MQYGNMSCEFEEEDKSCGRTAGLWKNMQDRCVFSDRPSLEPHDLWALLCQGGLKCYTRSFFAL